MLPSSPYHLPPAQIPVTPLLSVVVHSWTRDIRLLDLIRSLDFIDVTPETYRRGLLTWEGLKIPLCAVCWAPMGRPRTKPRSYCSAGCRAAGSFLSNTRDEA